MPDKEEIERRKRIMEELAQKSRKEFEENLPMSRDSFKRLFDFLDEKLTDTDCDDRLTITKSFLLNNNIPNPNPVLDWLEENGGGCDCEVLMNVEELFEN